MASPINYAIDDKDLDDAALWAVIDSAAASLSSSAIRPRKPHLPPRLAGPHRHSPVPLPASIFSPPSRTPRTKHGSRSPESDSITSSDGEVLQEPAWSHHHRPHKVARSCVSQFSGNNPISPSPSPPQMLVVKHVQRTPATPMCNLAAVQGYNSPPSSLECSPFVHGHCEEKESVMRHSLSGRFPTVSLFKEYQNAAMAILEKSDYTVISGSPYIKKSGWRKISFYFNLSYEIKDKTIEFDDNRNVQRAEFVVRAYMQGGRFSDGWGSCERREKRFSKPNHDIPSTAETRAKNKACQDLLGIGEYRPGAQNVQR